MMYIVMSCYVPESVPQRGEYAFKTALSLTAQLELSEHGNLTHAPSTLVIADDGSPNMLYAEKITRHLSIPTLITRTNRKGIGGSLNQAIKMVNAIANPDDLIMYITDDWVLERSFHFNQAIDLLTEYDMVRVGPLHPNLECQIKFNTEWGWWLHLHQTKGGFCFATRPFIATLDFFKTVGPFIEGKNAYDTEQDYAHRVSMNPDLALGALIHNYETMWTHIGEYAVGRIEPAYA